MPQELDFSMHKKGYPEAYQGQELRYTAGSTIPEAIQLGHFENEDAILRAAYNQRSIFFSDQIRNGAAAGKPISELAQIASSVMYPAGPRKGGGKGGNPEALAAARKTREANKSKVSTFDSLIQGAKNDPKKAKALAALGVDLSALGIDVG